MFNILLIILAGVGITNLIVNASILDIPRNFLSEKSNFMNGLINCMMCSGFWVGLILGLLTGTNFIFIGSIISLLSYFFGKLIDYIDISIAAKAQLLPGDIDE